MLGGSAVVQSMSYSMVRRGRRKGLDSSLAARYNRVARALCRSASDLCEVAEDGDLYGNAIAIVAIHSAIAHSDALCVAYGGFKSTDGEHGRPAEALQEALGARVDTRQLRTLEAILREKDSVSYQGIYYTVSDARNVVQRLEAFARWAEEMYDRRP